MSENAFFELFKKILNVSRWEKPLFKYRVVEFIRDLIVSHTCAFVLDLQIKLGWLARELKKSTASPAPVVALQVSTSMHDL